MTELFRNDDPREIVLRPYQADAIHALRVGIKEGRKRQILCAGTGAGKCLGINTPILMADGSIKMVQDVMVGDRLASPTGKPNSVVSVATGREQMYQITPTKGDPYTCNASHLLSLKKSGNKRVTLADGTKVDAHDEHVICRADILAASNAKARHCLKGWRGSVEAFDGESDDLPMPPYVFGIWLGDGSKRLDRCVITKPDGPVVAAWSAWGKSVGCYVRMGDQDGTRCPSWFLSTPPGQSNKALEALRATQIDVSTCAVPHAYKTAPFELRRQLLAGLLDTDGSVSRGGWDYISKHKALSEDVAFLARSIGLAAYVSECEKGIALTGFVGTYWRVSISGDAEIVPCRVKKPKPRVINKDALKHGIKIEQIGEGDYFGFELDGDRLFMLGDFTVTHNTVCAAHLLKQASAKGSYALFLVDRVSLVDQASATFDDYGIEHGVVQGQHPRWNPHENVQVCSVQTLANRRLPRSPSLFVYDEAHCQHKATLALMDQYPDAVKIGLTATPFTKGMGQHWDSIVNVIPTRALIDGGYLVEPTIYVGTSPDDSEYGINNRGEFSDSSASEAGVRIVGDVVAEWIGKTYEHFDGPAKTIVFSPTVEHGRELCQAFRAQGYNFQQVSYLDKDDGERAAKIAEFRKADSEIVGLVSCGVLTKGFDVPDVRIGISCKPYRKSLSSHMQEIGRIMRSHPGKDKALWFDHCGNIERMALDMFDVWDNGPGELDQSTKRDSKPRERDERVREALKCVPCGGAMRASTCTACGWERPARSDIIEVDGELREFKRPEGFKPRSGLRADVLNDPRKVWDGIYTYTLANSRKGPEYAQKWALGIWRGIYPGTWPPRAWSAQTPPNSIDMAAFALAEREVKRFRTKTKRRAA